MLNRPTLPRGAHQLERRVTVRSAVGRRFVT